MRVRMACLTVTLAALASGLAITSLPLAEVAAAPPGFVTADGDDLELDGQPYRFTGINVYHANNTDLCWDPMSDAVFGASLDEIGGERVIRAWFFQSLATDAGARDWTAFDRTMSFAASRGMKVIPTLGNQWSACDGANGGAGIDKNEAWYTTGYSATTQPGSSVPYRAWVAEVVARYADDPTVLAWQLMNEAEVKPTVGDGLPCSTNAAEILRTFASDVSTLVKSIDPDHLVSLGTIGGGQCGTSFEEYAYVHDLPTIDLCEYHDYNAADQPFGGDEFNGLQKRIDQCDALDKPLIIGESGIRIGGIEVYGMLYRSDDFRTKLADQLDAGIDGIVLWAWNPNGPTDHDFDIGPDDPVLPILAEVLDPPAPRLEFDRIGVGTPYATALGYPIVPAGDVVFAQAATVVVNGDSGAVSPTAMPDGRFAVDSLPGGRLLEIEYLVDDPMSFPLTQFSSLDPATGTATVIGVDSTANTVEWSFDPATSSIVYFAYIDSMTEFRRMDLATGAISRIIGEPAVQPDEWVLYATTANGIPVATTSDLGSTVGVRRVLRWNGTTWVSSDVCGDQDAPSPLMVTGDDAGNLVYVRELFNASIDVCRVSTTGVVERFHADAATARFADGIDDIEVDDEGRVWIVGQQAPAGERSLFRATLPDLPSVDATITLGLATVPAGASDTFAVTGALTGTLTHGQQLSATVTGATSNVQVSVPAGWAADVVCDDTDSGAGAASGSVVFRTAPGEAVRCTVVMSRPTPTPTCRSPSLSISRPWSPAARSSTPCERPTTALAPRPTW